ncbi:MULTISPECIES: adenylate/guanylate cyclase domain-containing protein [unclassified Mycobacterium]|uniref:adenylate/guanylate cyclase domain-containing protein n=1 Tax=unclassified Mycobacterium TaxID=2642494 RepID=UPI0029C8D0C1|nr:MULTISPECIES: adenylate/guanylate cyclase domain-containing protein [unclassified Mycobacterium]
MGFKDDCISAVNNILTTPFDTRTGREVPTSVTVKQNDGGVYLSDAAYLYVDMADSTGMATYFTPQEAARIIRAFLAAVCMVIRDRGGAIRSFDGDRVMAIFLGDDSADQAVDVAFRVTWAVRDVVHDRLILEHETYSDNWVNGVWELRHRTGIDVGEAFVVRAGVRVDNDLVSIGDPPNIAAKLSDFKKKGATTVITERVWDKLGFDSCYTEDPPKSKWSESFFADIGGVTEEIRTSTWKRPY